jgi:probable H4MPT-linked C1 transfer pathway protein
MREFAQGMSAVVGWDIGGVHLKAARAEQGRIVSAVQVASPLRGGLERLVEAFGEAKAHVGPAGRHVITMTGELADTFSSRSEGVDRLATLAADQLEGAHLAVYAGPLGFVSPEQARSHVAEVASANWHASAELVAQKCGMALFIDMGSTTTDIVPVAGGKVAARGYTDAERLAADELVYTGLVRSFIMATADRAPFGGAWTSLIHENFANMADVHRILGALPDGADQMATADGREKTVPASRARLARMIGCDATDAAEQDWTALAQWFAEAQVQTIVNAAMLVISAARALSDAPIVGAGIGDHVVREVARRLGRSHVALDALLDVTPDARRAAMNCAPAAAVALLAG